MGGWNWIDKTDMRWGKLVAKEYLGDRKWLCYCDCGNDTIVSSNCLKMDKNKRSTMSCGCNLIGMKKDINFFNVIDTEEKAYTLGILAADGTVEDNIKNGNYSFRLALQQEDRDILEKIKKAIKSEVTIKEYKEEVSLPQGGTAISDMVSLLICSKKIVQDLSRYGIISNKSLVLKINFELIPDKFKRHFLRGLFDGDGTFSMYYQRSYHFEVGLIGSVFLMNQVKELVLERFPNFKIDVYHAKGCNKNTYRWIISRREDFKQFLDYLYEDSNIYLDRKYNKYCDIKNNISNLKFRKSPSYAINN